METKYSCCKDTLAIYYQWIATVQEKQYHQGLSHTNLKDSLNLVLGNFCTSKKYSDKKKAEKKCTGCKKLRRNKVLSANDISHAYQISCSLLKCKDHKQDSFVKESTKIREIVGLPAASLNSPIIPINAEDIARVLRCLRRHLIPASSRKPGC